MSASAALPLSPPPPLPSQPLRRQFINPLVLVR
jgi:hypothetical protein